MRGRHYLVCLWTLFTLAGPAQSEFEFLERNAGESVVFTCEMETKSDSPYGFYLKRGRRQPPEVLFQLTGSEFSVNNLNDKNRTSTSGDPSHRSVNVTISELRADDTDRYFCEFVVDIPSSKDLILTGKKEFFLLVHPDTVSSMDIGFVETCAGGSAVLPCVPPRGGSMAVEGVILKRKKGPRAPVEVLYNSKHLHQRSPPLSQFPKERVQLSLVSSAGGMTYNLTLLQLQPEDSALYSCTLLLHGLPDSSTGLGQQVVLVSVQEECSCSSYSSLLYALSAAAAILLFALLIGCALFNRGRAGSSVKSHPQASPIYEEMTGMHADRQKLAPNHLEEMDSSVYKNCNTKKSCPENHYERPSRSPRRASP